MIGQVLSHYRLVERLGSGGMGVVYRAEDTSLEGREVAIKVLRPEVVADPDHRHRFLTEARAASSLQHPHVCEIHEIGERDDGAMFLVMEYYRGGTLRERMAHGMPAAEAFPIALAAAQALDHTHRHGIVHRDIKPANIVFTQDGYLKILDFGLARLSDTTHITGSGTTLGTAAYMSPEQASSRETDGRTDVWSLGVVLYQMLTGELPFHGSSAPAMLYAIRHEAPTPLSNSTLPPEAAAIVDRCLQKDPADRYPTAAALAEDIARLVDAEGWHPGPRAVQSVSAVGTHAPDPDSSAPTRPMSPPAGARPRRLRWLLGAGLLALAILLGREALRERSPFTTEIRAAVLAVEDRTGSESSELAAGLTVALSDLVSEVARHHPSMWVAPARHVAYAAPIDAAEARNTLGVNRVLTGQLVRFEDRLRITLTLEDTDDGQALDTVIVDFRTDDAGPLRDVLPSRFVRMFHLDAGAADDLAARLPTDGRAGADYLAGLGALEMAPDRAVTRLESAALRDSAFVPARERLGLAWLHQHRDRQDEASLARALDVLRPVRDAPGPGPGGADWLGDAFDGKGDVDSAMASYRAALARDPGDSYAANRIAKQFRGEGRFEEGAAVLRGVIEAAPDYSANHRDLANHLYKSDRSAEAEKEFQRALELAPDDPYSINALGAIHYAAGEWPRARELFERSFRLLPTYASCSNVGLMYFYEGNFKASARYYEYAVALGDTTDADVWGNLASSLYWVPGQRERAVTIYRRAIGLTEEQRAADPENVELRVDLADFHAMAGDEAEARELIDGLKGKLGRNGDLFYRVGCSLELLGDREAAMEKLSMAVRLGYPISILRGTPELGDFVTDVRFLDLVRALEEAPR